MLKKFISILKNLFSKSDNNYDEDDYEDISRSISFDSDKLIKPRLINNEKLNNNKIPITKKQLSGKIKKNILFLDLLKAQLEKNPSYESYLYKVSDLKDQSEASFKILFRLNEDKPYYQITVNTLYKHTMIIAELID